MKVEVITRRAMYEAREMPKFCPRCGGDMNRVVSRWDTADAIRRKRFCVCGKQFVTESPNPAINAVNRTKCEAKTAPC